VAHAEHFLERLDRVPRSLTDFALALYRDPERVRWIVRHARLPAEEERVALALGPAGAGPYIVVTRDGNFVTALGAEMTPKNMTILSRAQVDAFSARVDDARERLELAKEIVPPGKEPEDVMGLLRTRGWSLSREELSAMAAWVPLYTMQFFRDAYEGIGAMEALRATFLARRDKRYRNDPATHAAVSGLWSDIHGLGTRFVLAAMGDLTWADQLARTWQMPSGPTYPATRERIHSIAMRGAWAAARMGRGFVPFYRRLLSAPNNLFIHFDAALAMTAIGLRHSRYRDEARRAVAGMVGSVDASCLEWTKAIVAASEQAFDDPEGATDTIAARGAEHLVEIAARFAEGSRFRFARVEDVPRDLALLVSANGDHEAVSPFAMRSLPWVAKLANAEELYMPDELERALRKDWTMESVEAALRRTLIAETKPATHDGPRLGRNDPCSCGSGAKYKRCCGR
jgi:hypothetical protein